MAINFSASFAACLAAGLKVPRQIMYCISQESFASSADLKPHRKDIKSITLSFFASTNHVLHLSSKLQIHITFSIDLSPKNLKLKHLIVNPKFTYTYTQFQRQVMQLTVMSSFKRLWKCLSGKS
nr:unnamed protein product [Callosobruchus chinensis]